MEDRYLSLKELSRYSSFSISSLRGLMKEIPHYRLKRKIVVKVSEFDSWLERKRERNDDDDVIEFAQKILRNA